MARLDDIHLIAHEKLQKRFSLNPVSLKHPLPERSLRALGLIKIDGEVFSSKEFLRVLLMNINVAFVKGVRTISFGVSGPPVNLPLSGLLDRLTEAL